MRREQFITILKETDKYEEMLENIRNVNEKWKEKKMKTQD